MKIAALLGVMSLVALGACGNVATDGAGVTIAKSLTSGIKNNGKPAAKLSRQDLNNVLSPVQVVTVARNGAFGLMGKLRDRAGVETWATPEDMTISTRNGVILATRGFGADLMAADVPSLAQIASGAKGYTRAYTILDGEDHANRSIYRCNAQSHGRQAVEVYAISYAATKVSETCSAQGMSFTNEYWIGTDSMLRKSKQWIGPDGGFLIIEDTRR